MASCSCTQAMHGRHSLLFSTSHQERQKHVPSRDIASTVHMYLSVCMVTYCLECVYECVCLCMYGDGKYLSECGVGKSACRPTRQTGRRRNRSHSGTGCSAALSPREFPGTGRTTITIALTTVPTPNHTALHDSTHMQEQLHTIPEAHAPMDTRCTPNKPYLFPSQLWHQVHAF